MTDERSYTKELHFSASHFNGPREYELYELVRNKSASPAETLELLEGIHGHNFRVVVLIKWQGQTDDPAYLIEDEEIFRLVMRYNRRNLSLMTEFSKVRATTENIAKEIWEDLADILHDKHDRVSLSVSVYETPDIMAAFAAAVPTRY